MRGLKTRLLILFIVGAVSLSMTPASVNAAQLPFLDGIISIDGNHALDKKGVLWSWNEKTFEAVPILDQVKKISESNAAIRTDGSVWTWGRKPGTTSSLSNVQPSQVEGLDKVIDISGNYALKADGTVWSLGGLCEFQIQNYACREGSSKEEQLRPGRIGELENIAAIEGNGYFPIALAKDGTVWIWGYDKYGDSFLPITVLDKSSMKTDHLKGISSISNGTLVTSSWNVYIMNRYSLYGLTEPSFNLAKLAPNVSAVSGFVDGMGDFHAFSFVLTKDGKVSYWIWPIQDKKLYPVKGLDQVKMVSAIGEGAGTALHKDGTVSSWGKLSQYYGDDKYKYNYKIIPKKVVKGIGIRLNNKYHLMDAQAAFINGSVFVPVRGLIESLGGTVSYSNDIVKVKYGSHSITMEVWKNQATVDGNVVKLTAPVQIVSGSTMIPLRFVAQALGANVVWDGKNQEVHLTIK